MLDINPSGKLKWLLSRDRSRDWCITCCSSFEERCLSIHEFYKRKVFSPISVSVISLENPPTDLWTKGKRNREVNLRNIRNMASNISSTYYQSRLVDRYEPKRIFSEVIDNNKKLTDSFLVDITTMPKRYFLEGIKILLNSRSVKNLLVTYASAESYPEKDLVRDPQPPNAIQGFARIEDFKNDRLRRVVSLGFNAFNVEELISTNNISGIDFIFPFPPGSTSFRRNWKLLSSFIHESPLNGRGMHRIHRVHGLDLFHLNQRLCSWSTRESLDMIPLGSKPHALAMGLAYIKDSGHSQVLYPQPNGYNPDYSIGIKRDASGIPEIYGYMLKREGKKLI